MADQVAEQERRQWQESRRRLEAATADPALRRQANRILWEICQVLQDRQAALAHLQAAIDENPLFTRLRTTAAPPLRSILVLAIPGDFQANLPLEHLFDDSTALHTLWIRDPDAALRDPRSAIPAGLPRLDCVFIAVAEDARHATALRAADALAAATGLPVINRGDRIGRLSRAGTAALLHDLPDAVVPGHVALANGEASPILFPIIIRPLGSHAGQGLQRLDDPAALELYYRENQQTRCFTAAPFIDYRSADGAWRKYRLVFVDGVPYPLHLAIHDDWAVWYYNAGMDGHAGRLEEEARFLDNLAASFPQRALASLRELGRRVGLDYFGLDCSVLADGRLLVFEIETGMIVHERRSERGPEHDPGVRVRQAVERMIGHRSDNVVSDCAEALAVARR